MSEIRYVIPHDLWKKIGQQLFKICGLNKISIENMHDLNDLMVMLVQCKQYEMISNDR